VTDDLAREFAEACGATAPVDLRIERADGVLLVEGELDLPAAIIGRDPHCEVVLADSDVALRHASLQVIGGRVLVADLGSRTGVHGAAGGEGYGWLTPTGETRVGPFRLFLRNPVSVAPAPLDRLPNPLQPNPEMVRRLPRAVLRFLNGRADKGELTVNRLMTMVGRTDACKVSLAAADVADRHCYLLLTPVGLWVVDLLSPTGTWVNGESVRFARLKPTDEVQVGPFLLGVRYPDGEPNLPAEAVPTGFRLPKVKLPSRAGAATVATAGVVPAGSNGVQSFPADGTVVPQETVTRFDGSRAVTTGPGTLAEQVKTVGRWIIEHHRQEMELIAVKIDQLSPDRSDAAGQVLTRLAELNAELEKLQSEILGPERPEDAREMFERVAVLQDERHGLWQKLFAATAGLM
jgi:hypothetical protein